ncbi:MAG: 4a-hydroxytetrahydrobiopterin dehydratase [Flavobacteriaceae bacterium TMED238]|nr:MAG: 4a-hydroxytetrahydrobiopterin dehydratase [Flavobacteriaceae bacterium TMED238]
MLISPDEINKSLANKGWTYIEKMIVKEFTFDTFINGIQFINSVAELAERNNHHPEININWTNVKISITYHDMGGVSTRCVNLANKIDNI